jgi:hypothetical protein
MECLLIFPQCGDSMIKDITLRRLKDVKVKGKFTINCEYSDYFDYVRSFFQTSLDETTFRHAMLFQYNMGNVATQYCPAPVPSLVFNGPMPVHSNRFYIHYESLHELLKLREIFRIRANKFDVYLIKKRGYNPFHEHFFDDLRDPVIHKVRK